MRTTLVFSTLLTFAAFAGAKAATITWSAGQDHGFSRSPGVELPQQSLVRLGAFDVPDAVLAANAFNVAFLDAHFTPVDAARIGEGLGVPGHFTATHSVDTSAVVGQQMVFWVFDSTDNSTIASSIATALRTGILYLDKAVDPDWAFPANAGSTAVELTDLTNAAGNALLPSAHLVICVFPQGTSNLTGAANFGLPIPEPTAATALTVGLVLLGFRRWPAAARHVR